MPPHRLIPDGKYWQFNGLDGVASTGWAGRNFRYLEPEIPTFR